MFKGYVHPHDLSGGFYSPVSSSEGDWTSGHFPALTRQVISSRVSKVRALLAASAVYLCVCHVILLSDNHHALLVL